MKPARRRMAAIAIAIAGSAGLLTAGVLIGKAVGGSSMVPVSAPVFIDVPKTPTPAVTVNVPPPPPPPPAPPPPAPPPAPAPRAVAPHLDILCFWPRWSGAETPKACQWDDGFPAISADGTLIARKQLDPHPSGTGGDGIAIVFIDPKTSREVRRVVLLKLEHDYDFKEAMVELRPGVGVRLARQIAAVQRTLDEQGFRSMSSLDPLGFDGAPAKRVHAELDDTAVRIVDPERSAVLWQHRFGTGWDDPKRDPATDMCGGGMFRSAALWWDPATRFVLAQLAYTTGGCMCPTVERMEVHHIPAEPLAR